MIGGQRNPVAGIKIFLCLLDRTVSGTVHSIGILACSHNRVEGEDTHSTLLCLEALCVVQNKLVIDVEVISSAVTDQFHLHSITAGEGHTRNVAGNAAAPVITAAGGLIYNADLVRSHGRGHVHEELDHLTAAVDQQAELGVLVIIQHLADIELHFQRELLGQHLIYISILRYTTGYGNGGIFALVILQGNTCCGVILTVGSTEGFTYTAVLAI